MAIRKRLISPRQKMINLMYIVLLAMLALNVSTEVLDGFSLVDAGLRRTTANASRENVALYHDFAAALNQQPEKVKAWFAQAKRVKEASDSLYNLLQDLKVALVQQADGRDGDVTAIRHKDNVEAANIVMLAPGTGRGNFSTLSINIETSCSRWSMMPNSAASSAAIWPQRCHSRRAGKARTGRNIVLKTCP